jgi:hypothetical protein
VVTHEHDNSYKIYSQIDTFSVPPMMWVPAQQMRVVRGEEAKLVCYVEAHPEALVYWEHNGHMVQEGGHILTRHHRGTPKYKVTTYSCSIYYTKYHHFPSRLAWNYTYHRLWVKTLACTPARQKILEV